MPLSGSGATNLEIVSIGAPNSKKRKHGLDATPRAATRWHFSVPVAPPGRRSMARVMAVVPPLPPTTGLAVCFLPRPSQTYVPTLNDDGPESLRQAIAKAPQKGPIRFNPSLLEPFSCRA